MADNDEKILLGVETKGAVTELQAFDKSVKTLNLDIQKITKSARTFDENGRNQRVIIEGLTKNYEKFSFILKKSNQHWLLQENSLKKNIDIQKKYNAELLKSEKAQRKTANELKRKTEADKKAGIAVLTHKERVDNLLISMKQLEKVMIFFLVRRALYMFTSALRESIDTMRDFHASIAELRTISQESQSTFTQWEQSIIKLSNAWGFTALDVANAQYQVLSNQVAKGTTEVEIFTDSVLRFAKVTKSTAEDSVNLLTAAINAFGISSTEVDRVSSVLFRTIELGRVRATELADSFGRAAVPAAQMGISLEELAAMISTITIQGVKSTESMTLLRGIFMKLSKPTKEMKKLFSDLGVTTGEELIQVYGLSDAFKILFKRTQGTNTELAKLFGRIRPTMGMAALLSQLDRFDENFMKMGASAKVAFDNAVMMQYQTSGEKLTVTLNEIKNLFLSTYTKQTISRLMTVSSIFDKTRKTANGTIVEVQGLTRALDVFIRAALSMAGLWGLKKAWTTINKTILGQGEALRTIRTIQAMNTAAKVKQLSIEETAYVKMQVRIASLKASLVSLGVTFGVVLGTLAISYLVTYIMKVREAKQETADMIAEFKKTKALELAQEDDSFTSSIIEYKKAYQELAQYFADWSAGLNNQINIADEKLSWLNATAKELLSNIQPYVKEVVDGFTTLINEITAELKNIDTAMSASKNRAAAAELDFMKRIKKVRQADMTDQEKLFDIQKEKEKYQKKLTSVRDAGRSATNIKMRSEAEKKEVTIRKEINDLRNQEAILEAKINNAERSKIASMQAQLELKEQQLNKSDQFAVITKKENAEKRKRDIINKREALTLLKSEMAEKKGKERDTNAFKRQLSRRRKLASELKELKKPSVDDKKTLTRQLLVDEIAQLKKDIADSSKIANDISVRVTKELEEAAKKTKNFYDEMSAKAEAEREQVTTFATTVRDIFLEIPNMPEKLRAAFEAIDFKTIGKTASEELWSLIGKTPEELRESLFPTVGGEVTATVKGERKKITAPEDFKDAITQINDLDLIITAQTKILESTAANAERVTSVQKEIKDAHSSNMAELKRLNTAIKENIQDTSTAVSKIEDIYKNAGKKGLFSPYSSISLDATKYRDLVKDLKEYITLFQNSQNDSSREQYLDAIIETQTKLEGLQKEYFKRSGKEWSDFSVGAGSIMSGRIASQLQKLSTEIKNMTDMSAEQVKKIEELHTILPELEKQKTSTEEQLAQSSSQMANVKKELAKYIGTGDAFNQILKERTNAIENAILTGTTSVEDIEKMTNNLLDVISRTADALVFKMQQTTIELEKISSSTSITISPTLPAKRALGGVIKAANGMMVPSGTDTIPAMLTPGEFVLNKAATKEFSGRLVPMNYGQYYPSNNTDNSMSIGDINVNVNGQSSSQLTAREIAHALKGEIRSGMLRR